MELPLGSFAVLGGNTEDTSCQAPCRSYSDSPVQCLCRGGTEVSFVQIEYLALNHLLHQTVLLEVAWAWILHVLKSLAITVYICRSPLSK